MASLIRTARSLSQRAAFALRATGAGSQLGTSHRVDCGVETHAPWQLVPPRMISSLYMQSARHITFISDPFQREKDALEAAREAAGQTVTIQAYLRDIAGTSRSKKLRDKGRTPALLFSAEPDPQKMLLHMDAIKWKKEVRKYGPRRVLTEQYNLEVYAAPEEGEELSPDAKPLEVVRVLAKQMHVDAQSNMIENVNFVRIKDNATLRIKVPVMLTPEELCPGVRKGGWCNRVMPEILCICPSHTIPKSFIVDLSRLEVGDKVMLKDLGIPEGVRARVKDRSLPVLMISGKIKRAAAE